MKQELTGAQALLKRLSEHGTEIIFGIPGGNNLPIYDALMTSEIRHILAKHEQGAGFMAQGMARTTGKPAVCMATSGPGATNLITAISDAWSDSVPMIAITGQVPQHLMNTDAFQEVDVISMVHKITKRAYYITSADEIQSTIDEAFHIASSGRPGPVLIDIPKDVQLEKCIWNDLPVPSKKSGCEYSTNDIRSIRDMLQESESPIIISGHGSVLSGADDEIKTIAQKQQIPVVTTLHGIGILPYNHPNNIGMAGMHGFKLANALLSKSDLILALGIRFDDRLTGNIHEFCPNAKVIHIDINARELNRLKNTHLAIKADIKELLQELMPFIKEEQRTDWIDRINALREKYNGVRIMEDVDPGTFIRTISQIAENDAIVTTDVGQHQMWVAQSYQFELSGKLLTSGGQGTMGFGLPAAIGAAIAGPDKQVICFTGDGSLLMNIQELATLAEMKLNIKIIVLNNSALGMVRQQQQLFYKQNYSASCYHKQFDFCAIAKAFQINSINFEMKHDNISSIHKWLTKKGAALIDVRVEENEVVTPIIKPGKSVDTVLDCEKEVAASIYQ